MAHVVVFFLHKLLGHLEPLPVEHQNINAAFLKILGGERLVVFEENAIHPLARFDKSEGREDLPEVFFGKHFSDVLVSEGGKNIFRRRLLEHEGGLFFFEEPAFSDIGEFHREVQKRLHAVGRGARWALEKFKQVVIVVFQILDKPLPDIGAGVVLALNFFEHVLDELGVFFINRFEHGVLAG